MPSFAMLLMFLVAAFLVAWLVNGLVGLLSGEKPRDTGRLWLETFLRLLGVFELGFIGRMLNAAGVRGWPRKILLFFGLVCLLLFLFKACRPHHPDLIYTYPAPPP